jgi:hypothetical protein
MYDTTFGQNLRLDVLRKVSTHEVISKDRVGYFESISQRGEPKTNIVLEEFFWILRTT